MSPKVHQAFAAILLVGTLVAQEPGAPTFDANAKLVLVPFHVERGKYFAADLQPSDFVLHEDGHPREFTIFEGPNTAHPLPLELILLFDTTRVPPKIANPFHWDPKSDYEFLGNWDESLTGAILQKNGMNIRMAVYHYAGRQLERLCDATNNPREIVQAFRGLLDPIPQGKGELTLLPDSRIQKPMFDAPFAGWLGESIVSTLKDAAASPVPARRVLLVFTTGGSGTMAATLMSEYSNFVDPAMALSIPIDPVIMDQYRANVISSQPGPGGVRATVDMPSGMANKAGVMGSTAYRDLPWFASVGEKSGGETFVPPRLDREALAAILAVSRDRAIAQYVVGFSPDAAPKPKKHSLAVSLTSKSAGKLVGGEKNGVTY